MKWILSHASDDVHHWQLENEKGAEYLIFNRQWPSLRLTGTSKRLLFLRVQGILQKKVLLQTEYGFAVGETPLTEKLSAGPLMLNDQRFFYTFSNNQFLLMDGEKNLLTTCSLPQDVSFEKMELYGLLFGLAWFVAPEVAVENKEWLSATG